jgi:hypothetical protein
VTMGVGTSSSSDVTMIGGPCGTVTARAGTTSSSGGTSSSNGTMIVGPYGIGTSSSSGGTTAVSGCDSKTSSSTTRVRFVLGTYSSSYIMCMTNCSDETGSLRRRQLGSPDGAMARV